MIREDRAPALRARPAKTSRRSVAGSTFLVMAASALSALLGFGREIVTAHYYGTRSEMDAFINASTIPTVLFGVFNGALVAALVPTFSEYMSLGKDEEVRKLGSTVINAMFILMTVLTAFGWLFAPFFVPVVAHGFPPAEQALVVEMVRWLMPGIIATSLGGVFAALLNAGHRFAASALVWVAANIVTIGLVIGLHRQLGIFALVLGTVVGLFAQLLVQVPSLLQNGLYRLELDLHHPGLAKIWALLVPVAIGSSAGQVNNGFDRYFASTLSSGSTAGMGYMTKLAFLPVLVVASAIATVIFPLIAGQFANSDRVGIRRSISLAMRMVGFLTLPCAVALSVLAYPIVQTLFERGAFGPSATALCASLVPFACVPLISLSYNTVLGRACYACQEVRLAVGGAIVAVILNVAFSAAVLPILGARGLLLANGVSELILVAFQVVLLWRLIGGFEWRPVVESHVRTAFASLLMGGGLYILVLGYDPADTFLSHALYLCGLLVIGSIFFLFGAFVLGAEEATIAVKMLKNKFRRGSVGSPETAYDPIA